MNAVPKSRLGSYVSVSTAGEAVNAFVPPPQDRVAELMSDLEKFVHEDALGLPSRTQANARACNDLWAMANSAV